MRSTLPTTQCWCHLTSTASRKGSSYEREIVDYFRANGFPQACRTKAGARLDRGDIANVPGWTLELKNQRSLKLGTWIKEAEVEAINNETRNYVVVHKRQGKADPAQSYATLPLEQLVALIRKANQ